jgi:transcriptional regulator with XRE-family HTH domain
VTSKSFAAALKAAREAAGLSQAALARRAGLTGSYVCVLEAGRRRPPSPKVVAALAKVLGVDDGPLQELAGVERSPAGVRQRLERLDREHGRALRTRDRVLTTTLFHIAHRPTVMNPLGVGEFPDLSHLQRSLLGRLVDRVRGVRSMREAEERADEILEDAGPRDRDALAAVLPRVLNGGAEPTAASPTSAAAPVPPVVAPLVPPPTPAPTPVPEAGVALPVRERLAGGAGTASFTVDRAMVAPSDSPHAFLWRVSTDEAWPKVERGDLVLVDPDVAPSPGDLVAFDHDGRDHLRAYAVHGDEVRLQSPRAEVPPIRLPRSQFRARGVVRWVVRAL